MMKNNVITNEPIANYTPDVLGNAFEKLTLHFEDDYEGAVTATLVRKLSAVLAQKAVLYIHGFNDYFFQDHMANRICDEGINFYALDLRKYGRSLLPHQKLNNVRSLVEYDAEIEKSLRIIKSEGNTKVTLLGHSTGGLIVTHFAGTHLGSDLFQSVICNSPFYEFNLSLFERKVGIPILSFAAKYLPNTRISGGFSTLYGRSLHTNDYGEWNYSLTWKPHDIPDISLSFIRAIHQAQTKVHNNFKVNVPMLVLYSDRSVYGRKWSDRFMSGDAVLNVKHIQHYARKIIGNVTTYQVDGGLHDLVLSKKDIREKVFRKMLDWVKSEKE